MAIKRLGILPVADSPLLGTDQFPVSRDGTNVKRAPISAVVSLITADLNLGDVAQAEDASGVPYNPGNPGNWFTTAPDDVAEGLDKLAAQDVGLDSRITALEGAPDPTYSANEISYTVSTSAHWSPDPTEVAAALNQLASRVSTVESSGADGSYDPDFPEDWPSPVPEFVTEGLDILAARATDLEERVTDLEQMSGGASPSGGGGGSCSAVSVNDSGTTYDVAATHVCVYRRFTNSGTKTVNVRPNSTEALPDDGEWHFRNVGAGALTIAEGSGVTVTAPAGGSLVVPQGGTVTLKRVGLNEFDLFGVTS
jgi:hypothetical protein